MEENSIASIRERLNGIYKYAAENQAAFDAETKAIMERMHRIVSNKALIIWIIIGFVLWDVLAASRFIFPDATIPILMIIAGGTLSFKRISKYIDREKKMDAIKKLYDGYSDKVVPVEYFNPEILKDMIRIIDEGALSLESCMLQLNTEITMSSCYDKEDLKAYGSYLNASRNFERLQISQNEASECFSYKAK